MGTQFNFLYPPKYKGTWIPSAPPCLDGIDELEIDTETTGLEWWAGDLPIGISYRIPNGTTGYLPWGHTGGNLDEEVVKRWAQRELRGKKLTGLNIKFDNHMLHAWGVDLEEQGNTLADVGHYAALLDDHRITFNLEDLSWDYLKSGKNGQDLVKSRMARYHAGEVESYARQDVHLVGELKKVMWPELTKQDLHRVRELEEKVIYVVCEMERNGAKIDVELLNRWVAECDQKIQKGMWEIWRETGIMWSPTTRLWIRLFDHQGIPITEFTDKNAPSFTDAVLKKIDNPIIQQARRIARLMSINNKYLKKYQRTVGSDGILRYALHQLRAQKDEFDEHGAGTVTGRFSSAALSSDVGVNIQQVMKVAKQRVLFGYDEEDDSFDDEIFLIRQLHIPEEGEFLSADAMQIEYRIFASKAKSPRILQRYKEDPLASFHRMIEALIKPYVPYFTYRQTKDLNFMKIYAGGLAKLALMCEFISKYEFDELNREFQNRVPRTHPKLAKAAEVDKVYAQELPEVAPLLNLASTLAEKRGYVKTVLGRRMRFPEKKRLHKALNGVIQGSAADINKQKLVEVHAERKHTGLKLRFTVHDELDGDARMPETKERVQEILDRQSFPQLIVPILWEVKTGKSWKECA